MKKSLLEQSKLWDYQILKQQGRGEHGQVFKVRSKITHKIYALKKVNIAGRHQKQKMQAFQQIKSLKSLQHPHIIQYHESFLSMDSIYIVTEFAEKGDLSSEIADRVKKEKKFTEEELWKIFGVLISAIKHLHSKSIIHRDLKIENIFQTDCGFKVGDLGMSKVIYDASDLLSTRVGTPMYFAPEIIQHRLYSFPVDIWALGCIFYTLAALEHPFKDATIETLGYYIIDHGLKPIKGVYSAQMISFIHSMLVKNPQNRPTIYDLEQKLKEKQNRRVETRVSVYNLKQILSMRIREQQQENNMSNRKFKEFKQQREQQREQQNQQQSKQREYRVTDNQKTIKQNNKNMNNISMPLRKNFKISSYHKHRQSPIKSNGFSESPSPKTTRYSKSFFLDQQKYPRRALDSQEYPIGREYPRRARARREYI